MLKNIRTTLLAILGLLSSFYLPASAANDQITAQNQGNLSLVGIMSQGSMMIGNVAPGAEVFLNDQRIRTTSDGQFVIAFGRDAEANHILKWRIDGFTRTRTLEIAQREYATQRVNGVPQKTVTPSKDKLDRIKKETALVKDARKTNSDLLAFLSTFIKPLEGPVTGVYGSQRIYNGVPKRPHFGIDYAAPVGTIVNAPADGVVTLTHDDMYYSGGTLIVDHGYGVSSTFIHLSEILVKNGDTIKQGQAIAKVGKGGRASGPHLDWRINWFDVRVDPALVLELSRLQSNK